jgi:hypothetical protein
MSLPIDDAADSRSLPADLHALVSMTVQVVRRGAAVAVASLGCFAAAWLVASSLLGASLVCVGRAFDDAPSLPMPLFAAGMAGGIFIGIPLVFVGPLIAFGTAATGVAPTFTGTLREARRRLRRITVSYLVPWFLAGAAASIIPHIEPPLWRSTGGIAVILVGALAVVLAYVRFFFPAHIVVAVEEARDYLSARRRGDVLIESRFAQFTVAAVAPVAIALSAVPGKVGREVLMPVLGARTLDVIAFTGILGAFLVSVLVHSALAAAAYGLATRAVNPGDQATVAPRLPA